MAGHDTLRRDGGWTVELIRPITGLGGKLIDVIELQPYTFDHTLRWASRAIASVLGLLSDLSGLPEVTLRKLTYPDMDRVMIALSTMVPAEVRAGFAERPPATPPELQSPEERYEEVSTDLDPADPRYPNPHGPVKRFEEGEGEKPATPPEEEGPGLKVVEPGAMRRVGT